MIACLLDSFANRVADGILPPVGLPAAITRRAHSTNRLEMVAKNSENGPAGQGRSPGINSIRSRLKMRHDVLFWHRVSKWARGARNRTKALSANRFRRANLRKNTLSKQHTPTGTPIALKKIKHSDPAKNDAVGMASWRIHRMTHQSTKSKSGLQFLTNHDARFGLPNVADEVYEPFSRWMDGKLAELVDRWLPLAAPNASRRKRTHRGRRR